MLIFQWKLSQIGGIGGITGAAGSFKRILSQVDTAGGTIWIDEEVVTIATAESRLGDLWEESAAGKLIIVGDETSNDPLMSQAFIIQCVDAI
jgi:hypothetical protein